MIVIHLAIFKDYLLNKKEEKKLFKVSCFARRWVFNKPVDSLALNTPNYFSIISHPKDLGTIKSKLEKSIYIDHEEFVVDVRLTFSNAILYNPPANNVHLMAKELSDLSEDNLKSMVAKRNCGKPSGNLSEDAEKEQEPKYSDSNLADEDHLRLPEKRTALG
ncbi:Bromodomain [Dillenia turbinata]|uniref:Bromodomain n=1 Tax=Dillenia turbinata TaxID=194707 RepID=A0AAN8Z1C6_9MAGN